MRGRRMSRPERVRCRVAGALVLAGMVLLCGEATDLNLTATMKLGGVLCWVAAWAVVDG